MQRRWDRSDQHADPTGPRSRADWLASSPEDWDRFLAALADGVIVQDRDGRIVVASPTAARILGRDQHELLGMLASDPDWDAVHDDGTPFAPADFPSAVAMRTRQPQRAVVMGLARPSGGRVWIRVASELLHDARGEIVGLATVFSDISETLRLERELRAQASLGAMSQVQRSVFDSLGEGLVVQDLDGRIQAANPEARRILGLTLDEITGRTSFDPRWNATKDDGSPYPGEEHPAMITLATGKPVRDVSMHLQHPDGRGVWIRISSQALQDETGATTGVVTSFVDVTERRMLELRLRQSQRLEAVGHLAGGIAHDFNNLLAAILGNAELAREDLAPGSDTRELLDEVVVATRRAATLTQQLLAFARRDPAHPIVIRPAEFAAALAPVLRRMLGDGIDVVTSVGRCEGRVLMDPGQLEQILVNLALNARDAMPDGGRLTIHVEDGMDRIDDGTGPAFPPIDGPTVRISVTDTGIGIDPAILPRIFEPFVSTKGAEVGVGMGLATVHGMVGAAGGRVSAISTKGTGTTIRIDLPRVVAASAPSAPAPNLSRTDSGTILVIEDDEPLRRAVARMLRRLGYTVVDVANAAEALALSRELLDELDAVVSDVVMPGMRGPQLVDSLRALVGRDIPAVLASGYAPAEALEGSHVVEPVAFLSKPYTREMLASTLRRLLAAGQGSDAGPED